MKLRILDNSVRLRLRHSEVESFAKEGKVEAQTAFPTSVLSYSLEVGEVPEPQVSFENSRVRILVPRPTADAWTSGTEVAISGQCGEVTILIEKDFQRTHVKTKIDYDLYPNPRKPA
jgi:hypothetical protein